MKNAILLAGSLSNDLFRVASLAHRNSTKAAQRFLSEAQRWSRDLQKLLCPGYIVRIAQDVSQREQNDVSIKAAEQYLMYGILLQNYCLHAQKIQNQANIL